MVVRARLVSLRAIAGAFAVLLVLWEPAARADQYPSRDEGYRYSVYEEIAEQVLKLGLEPWNGSDRACQHNYFGDNPCLSSVALWRAFADGNGLKRNQTSARIFQAYVNRDYRLGDRLYATAMGYELPPYGGYEGPGQDIMALGLQPDSDRKSACQNDPLSSNVCKDVKRLWIRFAEKHGLTLNRRSAAIFQAYANGDFVRGDRLYADATGRRVFYERVYSNLSQEAREAMWEANRTIGEARCEPNYFADNPCMRAVSMWKAFAKKHGLKLDRKSAAIFQAYAEGEYEQGDTLYAAEKNITVAELIDRHPAKPRRKKRQLPSLIVDIWPRGL